MPPITQGNAPPSTLADLIGQVKDAFDAMGDSTPIMVGSQFLKELGVGSAPRVVFVPEPKGKIGPPIEMGNAASVTHSCDVFVRASESGDDIARLVAAYALSDLVIDCIQTGGTGRVEWGDYADDSPTDVDAYGADIALSFTYKRDVLHSPALWSLPAPGADTSGAIPHPPPGVPASSVGIRPTTTPTS